MPGETRHLSFDDVELVTERELGTLGRVFIVHGKVGKKTGEQPVTEPVDEPADEPVDEPVGEPAREADPWRGLSRLALRPLVAEGNESDEAVARLRADAEALVSQEHAKEHPNLLRVIGIGSRRDAELVALECPSQKTRPLSLLIQGRELSVARAVAVAHECASALAAVASTGRYHADLTTACVFVPELAGEAGEALGGSKLVPFALPPDYRVEHRASPSGLYRGSPEYAAPELHSDGGREPTEKSNIFAFGVMFYEMLAGQPPFRGGTPTRMLLNIRESTPGPPSAQPKGLGGEIPGDLDRICMRCLEKDPERRFPGFAALESSLRIAEEVVGFAAETPTSAMGVPASRRAQPVSKRTESAAGDRRARRIRPAAGPLAIFAAAAVVAAAALLLVFLSRRRSHEERAPRTQAAYDMVGRAGALVAEGKPEEAVLLLESHPGARDVDAAAFDQVMRRAELGRLVRRADDAYAAGRWAEAAELYERAAAASSGQSRRPDRAVDRQGAEFRVRLDTVAFHLARVRAEKAMAARDWAQAAKALEEASGLKGKAHVRSSDLARIERELGLARLLRDARVAGAEGDEASERELLFEALRLDPEHPAARARLAEIRAGPEAMGEALREARSALAAGDMKGTRRWAEEARERWPDDPEPGAVLAHVADRLFCEDAGMAIVSARPFGETWGAAERKASFCIDRYEYPGRPGELPVTGVSAVEAAARCRERGGRLCTFEEWQLACGGPLRDGRPRAYPYGDGYVRDRCNTEGGKIAPAGGRPGCLSAFGAYDMSGNVAEWTSTLLDRTHQLVAGGDCSVGRDYTRCDTATPFNPGLTSPRVGFRCCRTIPEPQHGEPPRRQGRQGRPWRTPGPSADGARHVFRQCP